MSVCVSALPAKPENISCVFYYGKNFTCTWSPEEEASHTWYRVKRTQYVQGCVRDGGGEGGHGLRTSGFSGTASR